MELIFDPYGESRLFVIVVYTQQEYEVLTRLNLWHTNVLGSSAYIQHGDATTAKQRTYRDFIEPGFCFDFKDTRAFYKWVERDWQGRPLGEPYYGFTPQENRQRFQDEFTSHYFPWMQRMLSIHLRSQGVYRYQKQYTVPELSAVEPDVQVRTVIGASELFDARTLAEVEQSLADRKKVPEVAETSARLERNETVVRLYLNLSQDDRALINEFGLDEIAYEDEPLYTADQLETKRRDFEAEVAAIPDTHRQIEMRLLYSEMLKNLQSRRLRRTLPDYLGHPYERKFDTRYQATEYMDRLEKVIRKIHTDIETYKSKVQNRIVTVR